MEVKGIGSYSVFTYNYETKKISSKSEDEADQLFVKYFNGELDTDGDNLPEKLTGFDYRKRGMIRNMTKRLMEDGYFERNPYDGDIEVGIEIEDAANWNFYYDGHLCHCGGISPTVEEMHSPLNRGVDFYTQTSEKYNPEMNSVKVGVGSSYELLKGYTFTVEKNKVSFQRNGSGGSMLSDQEAGDICQYLEAFLYFADQKCGSRDIYSLYNENAYNRFVQMFLQKLGVDTSQEFTVNETKCVFKNNQFVDAEYDNENGMVGARRVYEQVLARYEKALYAPLEHDEYYQKCV